MAGQSDEEPDILEEILVNDLVNDFGE